MGAYTRTYALTDGTTAYGSQVAWELDALGSSVNNIVNVQVSSGAAISDDKLAQITTPSKVSGAAITLLTSLPSGAGIIPAANIAPAFESALLHVREEQNANTEGGQIESASWVTRTLNTSKTNEITGASLGSNQITLPAGTYFIEASAPAYNCGSHKAKLYNTTDAADVIVGTTEYNLTGSGVQTMSVVRGRFTLAAQKVLDLRHRASSQVATSGLGKAANIDSLKEIYSEVMIWKIA